MNKEQAIAAFHADLKLCCDMGDRKDSVRRLAQRIGSDEANKVAIAAGLNSAYYWA